MYGRSAVGAERPFLIPGTRMGEEKEAILFSTRAFVFVRPIVSNAKEGSYRTISRSLLAGKSTQQPFKKRSRYFNPLNIV